MRKGRRGHGSEALDEAEINLTPLIDVVFVVLIMFIIVAPLLELEQIELASGPARKEKPLSSVKETGTITLHVRADNTLLLNGKALLMEQLKPELKRLRHLYPKAQPQLYQDKKALFGTYQEVKNCLEEVGFDELELILRPRK